MERIARESYQMSYAGLRLVTKGAKKKLATYFVKKFPMIDVWGNAETTARRFEEWHRERVEEISAVIDGYKSKKAYRTDALAAKFLNTFLHQLMKFKKCRPLWPQLHLPLDGIVFCEIKALARSSAALADIAYLVDGSPYSLGDADYKSIQDALLKYIDELNRKKTLPYRLTSRIEFNFLLWARK